MVVPYRQSLELIVHRSVVYFAKRVKFLWCHCHTTVADCVSSLHQFEFLCFQHLSCFLRMLSAFISRFDLIFGSKFLPRILGILLMVSGLGWMIYFISTARSQLVLSFYCCEASASRGKYLFEFWLIVKRSKCSTMEGKSAGPIS